MNSEGWAKIFISRDEIQVRLAEDLLKQHDIVSHIVSHVDSAIPAIGQATLYTPTEEAERAIEILKENDFKLEG